MQLRGNHTTTDRRLDRVPEFDERSRNFPIRTLVASKSPRSYTWGISKILDQGSEGACVGFGWTHELIAKPKPHPSLGDDYARFIYRSAQKIDEWAGEDYEGTSVLAGAKVIKDLGYMPEYRWAFSMDDGLKAIGHVGPAVLGLNWYEGMFNTDEQGFLHPSGGIAGGHCVTATGVSFRHKYVTGPNSWGANWGNKGMWKLSFDDLARLLNERGDFCIPVVRKLK